MAPRKKVTEEVKATAKKVSDKAAAEKIEVKKAVRTAARDTKAKATETKEKVAETKKKVAAKQAEKKETKAAAVAEVKDTVDATKIEAKKKTRATRRKVEEAAAPAAEAAKKATAKTRKVNLVFESLLGGTITPEDIIKMLPKEATSAYIKIEENTIYWVGKNGEMGSIEIW